MYKRVLIFPNIYSQTSLIRASLIRMPDNPKTPPVNLFYRFDLLLCPFSHFDSVIRIFHNPNTF